MAARGARRRRAFRSRRRHRLSGRRTGHHHTDRWGGSAGAHRTGRITGTGTGTVLDVLRSDPQRRFTMLLRCFEHRLTDLLSGPGRSLLAPTDAPSSGTSCADVGAAATRNGGAPGARQRPVGQGCRALIELRERLGDDAWQELWSAPTAEFLERYRALTGIDLRPA
ncbi:MAG: hypothetical protein R2749_28510 [Acidimicrobiales bacterium]